MKKDKVQAQEQSVSDQSEASPQFNSSLDYLKRISWLMNVAHTASVNDDDFLDWFWVLEQLHIELLPRMNPYEENILDTLMKRARVGVKYRQPVRAYHSALNILAHQKDLIMTDKETGPMALRGQG